jgi:hypothetical protein
MIMADDIEHAWGLQQRWSKAATAVHDQIDRARTLNLIILVLAAAAGALAGLYRQHPAIVRSAAAVSTVLLGLAGVIQQQRLGKADTQRWVAMRGASEQLKAAVWRELALGRRNDSASAARIRAALDTAHRDAHDFASALLTKPDGPTSAVPNVNSFQDYLVSRASNQATWHRNKAIALIERARNLRRAELAVTLLGVAAGATAAALASGALAPIVSALSTVAAAIAAHRSAARYERIADGYALTTIDLERVVETAPVDPDEAAVNQIVDKVEAILARQNTNWNSLVSDD